MRLRKKFFLLFWCLLLSFPVAHVAAQEVSGDTTATSYSDDEDEDTTVEKDIAIEKAAPLPRNAQMPDPAEWKRLAGDTAFAYRNATEFTVEKEEEAHEPGGFELFLIRMFRFFASTLGRILLWGGLLALAGYILYRIFSGDSSGIFSRSRKLPKNADDPPLSDDLEGTDWEAMLRSAQQKGDVRAAIRFSYMWLLQLLQERSLIQYRQDKTNAAYARELAETPYRQSFRDLARQYEYAWYGNFLPAAGEFAAYQQLFDQLKNQLRG